MPESVVCGYCDQSASMSANPTTSLNERTKHSSSTFMVSVSVPSMSNMTRCMGSGLTRIRSINLQMRVKVKMYAPNAMCHQPRAQLLHHRSLARLRQFLRPLAVLPREISPRTIFEVTFSPCGLEILLSVCSVTPVQTSFPIQQFKRNPTFSRNYSTGIMLLQAH